jgi:HAD superfamily hydrolase (TIGR01484 family)
MAQFEPLSALPFSLDLAHIKLIATDMDGTLTRQGRFTAELLQGLDRLGQANIPVVIVTGRSAGWVQGLAHYLPIAGAMAENGGVYIAGANAEAELLTDLLDLSIHRQRLAEVFEELQQGFPHLTPSCDNLFRLTDWTFDVAGLTQPDLDRLKHTCERAGWGFTYSTVQCHLYPPGQSKAVGLQQVLNRHFPEITPQQIITVGDSPNDESLFDRNLFPHAVGVANLKDFWPQLRYHPAYLSTNPEVDGFLELVDVLLGRD